VSIEGHWLQTKDFTPGLIQQANDFAAGDILKFPYAVLTIDYDKKEEGNYLVEGITASDFQFFRFRSNRVWTKLDDQTFLFTYTADMGDSTVGGLTELVFYPAPDGNYTKATGKFIDDRGFRINFRLEKLNSNMDGANLRDPDQQIKYMRSLLQTK